MDKPRPKSLRRWAIRAAGSALFLAVLAWLLPVGQIVDGLSRVPLNLFLLVWVGFVAGHAVAAAKWRRLLGTGLNYFDALRAHVAGLAANLALPGAAGGDVVRAGVAQMALRDGGRVISGSVADRLIDMLALAILAGIGALALGNDGWDGVVLLILVGMGASLVAAFWILPRLVPWAYEKWPRLPAAGLANTTADAFAGLAARPVTLVATLSLSIAIQALFVWLAMQLGLAVGVNLPMAVWFLAWPLAKLLAVLPVSLNGLGLREATLAGLMVPFGADGASVVAAGLAWQAVLFATGGLGAAVLAMSGFRLRPVDNALE